MGTAARLPRFALGCAALAATTLGAQRARAADDAPAPHSSEEAPSRWYGWQTLATDGAAIGLITASLVTADNRGGRSPSSALAWGALGVYGLGAPVMHFVHENPGRGLASFGMRSQAASRRFRIGLGPRGVVAFGNF